VTGKQRHEHESGQGLVEFALVLPALLLTLMGIADFGRAFAIYSNLTNAAREGTRYGVVSPLDVDGITWAARNKIAMADPASVDIYVYFDSGPGTPTKDFDAVTIGDRVIVALNYDIEMVTPFIHAITSQLHVETTAVRTISTLGDRGSGGVAPLPPTSTPDGTTTPSPTPTVPSLDTATPTATGAAPSSTPTPTPGVVSIQIDSPLWDGDLVVTGIAQPGEVVYLRDIQNPALDLSVTVNADGTFRFDVPPLVAGHVIAVQGYDSIDYAVVEGATPPTATPTPTAAPATPTPDQPNLVVESVILENEGVISTYDPLTFTVAVRNIGATAADSLFWVDLYVDPALEPSTPGDLTNEASVAWAAVSSLAQNEAISLTLNYLGGVDATGDHTAYALADIWDQVLESDELDNVSASLPVTVTLEGVPPTPTSIPAGDGAISGSTWLYTSDGVASYGRVNVSVYDGDVLIAGTLSDRDGNYLLAGIPAGSFTVIGEAFIDGVLYSDTTLNVQVNSGQTTPHVTLVLH
jgi:hypothetical protein